MKGGDKDKRRLGQELPGEGGSDNISASISAVDSADDRRGQLERIGEIEKRL